MEVHSKKRKFEIIGIFLKPECCTNMIWHMQNKTSFTILWEFYFFRLLIHDQVKELSVTHNCSLISTSEDEKENSKTCQPETNVQHIWEP